MGLWDKFKDICKKEVTPKKTFIETEKKTPTEEIQNTQSKTENTKRLEWPAGVFPPLTKHIGPARLVLPLIMEELATHDLEFDTDTGSILGGDYSKITIGHRLLYVSNNQKYFDILAGKIPLDVLK